MAGHFLLSAKARSLNLRQIARMSEDEAYSAFRAVRFAATGGAPVCPRKDCRHADAYDLRSRRIYRCKSCKRDFSVTVDTPFESHKLDFQTILYAIAIFVMPAKGISAIQFSQMLQVSYPTAWETAHKLRSAMAQAGDRSPLKGEIEFDGAQFGDRVRPTNKRKERDDSRWKKQRGEKRVQSVIVVRERGGRAFVDVQPREKDAQEFILRSVGPKDTVKLYCDQGSGWHQLRVRHKLHRVNHSQVFWTPEADTNQAESFFSVMRRSEWGVYHRIAGRYLLNYAHEIAWRQNERRSGSADRFSSLTAAVLTMGRAQPRKSPAKRSFGA